MAMRAWKRKTSVRSSEGVWVQASKMVMALICLAAGNEVGREVWREGRV